LKSTSGVTHLALLIMIICV